jgi:hypothetical protein
LGERIHQIGQKDESCLWDFLLGFQGDQINALMVGRAFNLKMILRAVLFVAFVRGIIEIKIAMWLK